MIRGKQVKQVLAVTIAVMVILSATLALADNRVDVSVSNACLISPGNDSLSSRILFKFDLPSKLDDKRVDYAEVVFEAKVDTLSRHSLMFVGYPLTTDWSAATSSWSSPWTNEGGDYNESLRQIGLIKAGSYGQVRFDITRLVTAWQQGSVSNHGLIIMPLNEERKIRQLVHPAGFPQGVFAKVTIYFSYTHP
jgi:hypothetical protein